MWLSLTVHKIRKNVPHRDPSFAHKCCQYNAIYIAIYNIYNI